jgi:hypothetical protein
MVSTRLSTSAQKFCDRISTAIVSTNTR